MRFKNRWTGEVNNRYFVAKTSPSDKTQRKCTCCGGKVRRSWITRILHSKCRSCRYLIMMYGPNITVRLVED